VGSPEDELDGCIGFDWDDDNVHKNWDKHRVTAHEAEDVFFHEPLVVAADRKHSVKENRFYVLGQTAAGRRLFLAFTVRRSRIRVISARDMNSREREAYRRYEANS
jgi:uncharacterized DUF497 family protein